MKAVRVPLAVQRLDQLESENVGPKCKKWFDLDGTWYSGIFEVADYESELKNQELKMTDRVWSTKIQIVTWFEQNSVLVGFWCWLRFITSNSKIQQDQVRNGGPKYKKWLVLDETRYLMVSELANCDIKLTIRKIQIVD